MKPLRRGLGVLPVLGALVLMLGACSAAPPPVVGDDGLIVVTPVVDSVGVEGEWLSASGYVEGVAEDGGRCNFTFRGSGGGASRLSSTGEAQGNRTVCGTVEERIRTLFPGDYELTLSYESPTARGESEPAPVTIPEVYGD